MAKHRGVCGNYDDPINNFSDQYNAYSYPQSTSNSGGYFCNSQEDSYCYGYYYYDYNPIYCQHQTYVIYYPEIYVPDYNPYYIYFPYYVYVPIYSYYYVTNTDNSPPAYDVIDAAPFCESPMISHSEEYNLDTCEAFDYCLFKDCNGSCVDSSKEIVGEEQTTCHLLYEEYPEILNEAPVDDEKISVSSNIKLEKEIECIGPEVNKSIAVYEQAYSVERNLCEDDVDRNLIKDVSLMNIEDIKEQDDNYEFGKEFVYYKVLKGYIETKSQLEELEWDCHVLDDIPEEGEPEFGSNELDSNESVFFDLKNIIVKKTSLSDVVSSSLSEESITALSEKNLHKECPPFTDKSQTVSHEQTLVKECRLVCEVSKTASNEKTFVDEVGPLCEESQTASSQKTLLQEIPTLTEEPKLPVQSLVVEESPKTESVPDVGLSNEEIDPRSFSSCEIPDPNVTSADLMEETPTAPDTKQRKKRFSRLRKFFARICCCITKPP